MHRPSTIARANAFEALELCLRFFAELPRAAVPSHLELVLYVALHHVERGARAAVGLRRGAARWERLREFGERARLRHGIKHLHPQLLGDEWVPS